MGGGRQDPTAIRSVAVTAEDVVAAVEARRQRDQSVVLRVTPPFSGRMRARLHVPVGTPAEADPGAIQIHPGQFLRADAPAYPRPADTEDELRADPGVEYTVERHHDRHAERVSAWRESVREHFAERLSVETPEGSHTVDVTVLG